MVYFLKPQHVSIYYKSVHFSAGAGVNRVCCWMVENKSAALEPTKFPNLSWFHLKTFYLWSQMCLRSSGERRAVQWSDQKDAQSIRRRGCCRGEIVPLSVKTVIVWISKLQISFFFLLWFFFFFQDKDDQKDVTASTDSLSLLLPENSNMKVLCWHSLACTLLTLFNIHIHLFFKFLLSFT